MHLVIEQIVYFIKLYDSVEL